MLHQEKIIAFADTSEFYVRFRGPYNRAEAGYQVMKYRQLCIFHSELLFIQTSGRQQIKQPKSGI
jgi:hypothetical protein